MIRENIEILEKENVKIEKTEGYDKKRQHLSVQWI